MNIYGIRAIYHFEMARTFRTLWQSIVAPVLTTSLYFIVFGKAIGSRITVNLFSNPHQEQVTAQEFFVILR